MPRSAEQTERRILEAAYGLFYRDGFTRVSVDDIAAGAGITKRTLYHHFTSKDELLARTLELQHKLALEQIETWAAALKGGLAVMIDALFAEIERWARKPGWTGTGFTRVTMELADLPGHPARQVARRHKAALTSVYARLLTERGADRPAQRADELIMLIEGAMVLSLIRGDTTPIIGAAAAAQRLMSPGIEISCSQSRHAAT